MDSWANVYVQYVDQGDEWTESLQLADGSTARCRTEAGPKGIPKAYLAKSEGIDQIDLLPMQWLYDRWCKMTWDENRKLTTPTGRQLQLHQWDGLPYLTAIQIQILIEDLPEASVLGRNGKSAGMLITAAAVKLKFRASAAQCRDTRPPATLAHSRDCSYLCKGRDHRAECQQAAGPPGQGCLCGAQGMGSRLGGICKRI